MCYYIATENKYNMCHKGAIIMNHEEIFQARVKAARYDQLCYILSNVKIFAIVTTLYCLWYFNA